MQTRGIKGDKVTMAGLVLACTHLGALELGKWCHACIMKQRIEVDVALGTALVDMYAKCGSIETAIQVFHGMPEKDVMAWTALILGLAMCGQAENALQYFDEMQIEGVEPDAITFVGVLAACSHAGLVDEGIAHFNSMSDTYDIQPTVEHYGGLVDMLGRAGRIADAEELIESMPMAPDHFVLGGLLENPIIELVLSQAPNKIALAWLQKKHVLQHKANMYFRVDGSTNPHALFPTKTGHSSG
ncbi:hypothetical protein OIU74_026074 [Salix koriyanagi]|uniref:Pentatricopeptide repeat-containing protein n=1 Tax=Salix koriyanagi TaxID=2511006 RepID=A0A9Q0W356_9ROSI|nr:hypothetical protein OIU74_026074 [Salix koriyanagi]